MRFEVPQFIDIEDKIFGPLTWRQFLYLGGGVGMAVVMFFMLPFIVFVIFGLPLAALSGALAFYPVNNRPFSYFLEALINYFSGQRLYLWRRQDHAIYKGTKQADSPLKAVLPPDPEQKRDISSLARRLELQAIQKKP